MPLFKVGIPELRVYEYFSTNFEKEGEDEA
jgi:hypothetical protein